MPLAEAKRLIVAVVVGYTCGCAPAATAIAPVESPLEVPRMDGGGGAAEAPTGGVRFGRVAPSVGARWQVATLATSRTADPQGGDQVSTYASEYDVEVLAVAGPAPSRVRLRFTHNAHVYQGADKPTVLHGRTYLVDAVAPHVRDASGGTVSEEEERRVLDIFPDLGTRARIDEVLPDDVMRVGERRDDFAAAVLRVIHPRAWTQNAGAATLARVEGDEAVFTLSLDAASEGGIRMVVSGDARVRLRDARLTAIALDGTYEHGGAESTKGSFTLRRTVRDW